MAAYVNLGFSDFDHFVDTFFIVFTLILVDIFGLAFQKTRKPRKPEFSGFLGFLLFWFSRKPENHKKQKTRKPDNPETPKSTENQKTQKTCFYACTNHQLNMHIFALMCMEMALYYGAARSDRSPI